MSFTKSDPVVLATIEARVVFPQPGGPKNMLDWRESVSMALLKSFPLPTICCWPTNSSSVLGRILSASGACLFMPAEKRSMPLTFPLL